MLRRLLITLAVVVAALGVPAAPPATAAAVSADDAEAQFLELLNMERVGEALDVLALDGAASDVARAWSRRMASAGRISHNPDVASQVTTFVTREWGRIGENVGVGGEVGSLHRAFWSSPGHRQNMLGDFNRVGVGVAVTDRIWVTFVFVKGPALRSSTGLTPCPTPGYLLDGFGGVHPVGGAPSLNVSGYWPGWDIARDLAFAGDSTRGYVLDGFGGLHAVGGAPAMTTTGYWPGWDIARSVAVLPSGLGAYVLDRWGGIHRAGAAPPVRPSGYWPGWDIARDIQVDPGGLPRGYVLDGFGGLHPFGGMPAARIGGYRSADVMRSFVFLADGTGGYVTDAFGAVHPFAVGSNPMPPAVDSLPLSQPSATGVLLEDGHGAVVTNGGARLGANARCATPGPWGRFAIVRAAVSD